MTSNKETINNSEIKEDIALDTNSIPILIYARASTNNQESGISTQLSVVTEKIESLGYRSIVETFTDEGVSGDILPEERSAFQEMLNYIKNSRIKNPEQSIKEVWVQTRNRIARNVDYLGYTTVLLEKLDVELHSTEDDDSNLKKRIYDVMGEEELRKTRLRSEQGIERRLKEKKVMSRAPYGYKIIDGKLVVDEELRSLITEIFRLFNNNHSYSRISQKFKIPTSTLSYMVRNPIYRTGEYLFRGKVAYRVEPIIKMQEVENN